MMQRVVIHHEHLAIASVSIVCNVFYTIMIMAYIVNKCIEKCSGEKMNGDGLDISDTEESNSDSEESTSYCYSHVESTSQPITHEHSV